MNPEQARWFLRGATIGFLDDAPKLADEYAESVESMRLFWEQTSSALVLSIPQLLAAAQSVTFAQVHDRARPSVEVARAQADVLTETFLRPWVQDLIAALHRFLEIEGGRNRKNPQRPRGQPGAPSAMAGFHGGWEWANGPEGAAHHLWLSSRSKGPWPKHIEKLVRKQEEDVKRSMELARRAAEKTASSSS